MDTSLLGELKRRHKGTILAYTKSGCKLGLGSGERFEEKQFSD